MGEALELFRAEKDEKVPAFEPECPHFARWIVSSSSVKTLRRSAVSPFVMIENGNCQASRSGDPSHIEMPLRDTSSLVPAHVNANLWDEQEFCDASLAKESK